MRTSVSNIAWDTAEDGAMADLFVRLGIDAIDIAPGKYFPQPESVSVEEVASVRRWWEARGIAPVGMQSLLFGTTGLNVFGDAASQAALRARLVAVMRIGAELGATRLVFGSPRNRDRSGWDDDAAHDHAADFFGALGEAAAVEGVVLCLEPNPEAYGANFLTRTASAEQFVRRVNHAAIRLQLDTGAATMNAERTDEIVASAHDVIGHVHVSEPMLAPVGDGGTDHVGTATALREHLPGSAVTIEMRATTDEPHLGSVERAARFVLDTYGQAGENT